MADSESHRAHRARQLLGIHADASISEIDNAYRRLVRRLHPDTAAAPPLATLAQAQGARELLRALAQATRHQEPPPTPRRVRDARPPAPRERTPDIRVGPVRYHGPSPRGGRPRRQPERRVDPG